MIKRLCSFITAVAIVCTAFSTILFTSSAVPAVAADTEFSRDVQESVALMEYLKIFKLDSRDASKEVTRADFAIYIARFLKMDEYAKTDKLYYADMPQTHWAAASVNNLTECGVLNGGDNQMFYPDNTITVTEASKMMLSLMGYDQIAAASGGYPNGYTSIARELDFYDGIDNMQTLTRKNAAVLLANAVCADICEVESDPNGMKYTPQEGKTLLSRYYDMYYTEGRLDVVNETALYDGEELESGIRIDGEAYEFDGETDLIGSEVKVFYKEEDGTAPEALLIFSRTDDDDILEITAEELEEFTEDYRLIYCPDGSTRKKTAKISKNVDMIYNGITAGENIVDLVNIKSGTIRAIRSKGSSEYDVLIVRESETFVAAYADTVNEKVYDSANSANVLDLSDNNEKVRIFDENGNKSSIASIAKDSVLSVYRSAGKRTEVWISTKTVTGTYVGESEYDGKTYFKIDDEEYPVSGKYLSKIKSQLVLMQEATFGLDMEGTIACIAAAGVSSEYEFGYYLSKFISADNGDDELYLKLYTQDDGLKSIKTAKKVKIDGEVLKDAALASEAFEKSYNLAQQEYKKFTDRPENVESRIIRFKRGDNNEIIEIDTPYMSSRESENSLRISSAGTNLDYIYVGIIGYDITFDSNTVLFSVPPDSALDNPTEKMFGVRKCSTKSTGGEQSLIGYKVSDSSAVSDLVVHITDVKDYVSVNNHVMVDRIESVISEDGEVVEQLTGWKEGSEVKYIASENVRNDDGTELKMKDAGIDNGDILLLAFNAAGEISSYSKVYDESDGSEHTPPGIKGFTKNYFGSSDYKSAYCAGDRLTIGYVNKILGNTVEISYELGGPSREIYPVNTSNTPVTVHDSSRTKNNIYKGSISDLVSYEDAGTECSKIIVHTQYVVWKSYYVFK